MTPEPMPPPRRCGTTYISSSNATWPAYHTLVRNVTSATATAGAPATIANVWSSASRTRSLSASTPVPGDGSPNSVLKSCSSRATSSASSGSASRGLHWSELMGGRYEFWPSPAPLARGSSRHEKADNTASVGHSAARGVREADPDEGTWGDADSAGPADRRQRVGLFRRAACDPAIGALRIGSQGRFRTRQRHRCACRVRTGPFPGALASRVDRARVRRACGARGRVAHLLRPQPLLPRPGAELCPRALCRLTTMRACGTLWTLPRPRSVSSRVVDALILTMTRCSGSLSQN